MEVKMNFTKVPNQLLRHQEGLSALEKLFLIYLLSHKVGYHLTDVQSADNLGMSRNTVVSLREKLSLKGYISSRRDSLKGLIYSVNLGEIIPQCKRAGPKKESGVNIESIEYQKLVSAFKQGLKNFRESEHYPRIIEKEYITETWHKREYSVPPKEVRNINQFIKENDTSTITTLITLFEDRLHIYLINKIFDHDFFVFRSQREIVPTISFFLKSKSAYEELKYTEDL